jgi:hypothetical protein
VSKTKRKPSRKARSQRRQVSRKRRSR